MNSKIVIDDRHYADNDIPTDFCPLEFWTKNGQRRNLFIDLTSNSKYSPHFFIISGWKRIHMTPCTCFVDALKTFLSSSRISYFIFCISLSSFSSELKMLCVLCIELVCDMDFRYLFLRILLFYSSLQMVLDFIQDFREKFWAVVYSQWIYLRKRNTQNTSKNNM